MAPSKSTRIIPAAPAGPSARQILVRPLIILGAVVVIGIIGYVILEDWTPLDAAYMVAITLSTVGFGEVHQISPAGRVFTLGLIVVGISTGGYVVARLGEMFIEGQLRGFARRRRMNQRIKELKEHYIVCGFGRVGRQVCEELVRESLDFVVVDSDAAVTGDLEEEGFLHLIGDATEDDTLEEAGIKQAAGVVVAVDSDSDAVFVTLTARSLNASVLIVAAARNPDTEPKLRRAGATRVVSPFLIAGRRMASMVLRPNTVDFLDTIMRRSGTELYMEEITIPPSSDLLGKSLKEADLRRRAGIMVLAIVESDGKLLLGPDAATKLTRGQMLIVLGTHAQLQTLRQAI